MRYYLSTFLVRGGFNAFPVDMLRYDGVYPQRSDDVSEIEDSLRPERRSKRREDNRQFEVRLVASNPTKNFRATGGRWASFGWHVSEEKTEVRNDA